MASLSQTGVSLLGWCAPRYRPTPIQRRSRRRYGTVLADAAYAGLFVLGDGLLDRMQIERRTNVTIASVADQIWVTSPEDQVLRKLDYLNEIARQLDLGTLLDDATTAATMDR